MRLKILLCVTAVLILSGCLDEYSGVILSGKYVCNNSDTFRFEIPDLIDGKVFYATEYMEFTHQTVELTGIYEVNDHDELILKYEMFGAVRRFNITNSSHTLIENDAEGMRFDWVES